MPPVQYVNVIYHSLSEFETLLQPIKGVTIYLFEVPEYKDTDLAQMDIESSNLFVPDPFLLPVYKEQTTYKTTCRIQFLTSQVRMCCHHLNLLFSDH